MGPGSIRRIGGPENCWLDTVRWQTGAMTWSADVMPAMELMAPGNGLPGSLKRGGDWGLPTAWRWLSVGVVTLLHAGVFWHLLHEKPDRIVAEAVKVVQVTLLNDAAVSAAPISTPPLKTNAVTPPRPPSPRPPSMPAPAPMPATAKPALVSSPAPAEMTSSLPAPQATAAPPVAPGSPSSAPVAAPAPPHAVEAPVPRQMASSAVSYAVPPPKVYPAASLRMGEAGVVQLRVLVDEHGRAVEVQIQRSSGFSRLDQAAAEAIRSARFNVLTENGVAQSSWVVTPYRFDLQE